VDGDLPLASIFHSRREFSKADTACTRNQFTIATAHAMTAPKSQVTTVPQAVFSITKRDFASGLTYVAASNVKSLDGLLVEEALNFERFHPRKTETTEMNDDIAWRARKRLVLHPQNATSLSDSHWQLILYGLLDACYSYFSYLPVGSTIFTFIRRRSKRHLRMIAIRAGSEVIV
jgi:hypothetical protein